MKRLFISFAICFISLSMFAQSGHLSFKGVPIDGTLGQYTEAMKSKGFSYVGTQDGMSILMGDFAGFKGCTIGVSTLQNKDLVNTIGVIFPEKDSWTLLYGNYSTLKEMLTEKYGQPSTCVETFETSPQPRDDNSRMYEVKFDRCKYFSVFSTENGDIELSISNSSMSCFVLLKYYDKINSDIVRAAAMEDL